MQEHEHDESAALRELWCVLSVALAVVGTALAWLLPARKPDCLFGRLSYGQSVAAVLISALSLSVVIFALAPRIKQRLVAFRLITVWLAIVPLWLTLEFASGVVYRTTHTRNPFYLGVTKGFMSAEHLPYTRPAHLRWEGFSFGDSRQAGERDPQARRIVFETDESGFRNETDQRSADVVYIGDSFTEAGNVNLPETFVQRSATQLGLTFRNLGRAGYSPVEELIVLRESGLRFRPRYVVWQLAEINDLYEAIHPTKLIESDTPQTFTAQWTSQSPSLKLFNRLRDVNWPLAGEFRCADDRFAEVRFRFPPSPFQRVPNNPGWPIVRDTIRQGAELLASNDIQLIVFVVPMKIRVLGPHVRLSKQAQQLLGTDWLPPAGDALNVHMRAECAALGITFVDVETPLADAVTSGELVYLQFDTHLSPKGHEVVSNALVHAMQTPTSVQTADLKL